MTAAIPASHRDLLETPGVGVLGTVGADGMPQSTAVWFLFDDDLVRGSFLSTRQKVRNLRRHPKGSLLVLDPGNPYRTIELRGEVAIEADPERAMLARMLEHYGVNPDTFPDDTSVDRVRLTLTPGHVTTYG